MQYVKIVCQTKVSLVQVKLNRTACESRQGLKSPINTGIRFRCVANYLRMRQFTARPHVRALFIPQRALRARTSDASVSERAMHQQTINRIDYLIAGCWISTAAAWIPIAYHEPTPITIIVTAINWVAAALQVFLVISSISPHAR